CALPTQLQRQVAGPRGQIKRAGPGWLSICHRRTAPVPVLTRTHEPVHKIVAGDDAGGHVAYTAPAVGACKRKISHQAGRRRRSHVSSLVEGGSRSAMKGPTATRASSVR